MLFRKCKKETLDSSEVGGQGAAPAPSTLIKVSPSEPEAVKPQDDRAAAAADSSKINTKTSDGPLSFVPCAQRNGGLSNARTIIKHYGRNRFIEAAKKRQDDHK